MIRLTEAEREELRAWHLGDIDDDLTHLVAIVEGIIEQRIRDAVNRGERDA